MKKLFYAVFIPILAAGLFAGGCNQKKQEVPVMSSKTLLIDVRSEEEFNSGHHAGAVNIPHTQIAEKISAFAPGVNVKRATLSLSSKKNSGFSCLGVVIYCTILPSRITPRLGKSTLANAL